MAERRSLMLRAFFRRRDPIPKPLRPWLIGLVLSQALLAWWIYRDVWTKHTEESVPVILLILFLIVRVLMAEESGHAGGGCLSLVAAWVVAAAGAAVQVVAATFVLFGLFALFESITTLSPSTSLLLATAFVAAGSGWIGLQFLGWLAQRLGLAFDAPPLVRVLAGAAYGMGTSLIAVSGIIGALGKC